MAEHDEELRALQKRAYGPSADIDGDASALSRLHELEARSRAAGQASGEGAAAAGATLVDAAPDDPVPRGRARRAAGTVASDLPASASASTPDAGTSPADPRLLLNGYFAYCAERGNHHAAAAAVSRLPSR